jgi:hypothetical protein
MREGIMKNIRDFSTTSNVCILVRKKWTPSKLVQYYCGPKCGILLNRKPESLRFRTATRRQFNI